MGNGYYDGQRNQVLQSEGWMCIRRPKVTAAAKDWDKHQAKVVSTLKRLPPGMPISHANCDGATLKYEKKICCDDPGLSVS